jgi:succinate dehydrogenase / fumarate reductase cytochrome b subunit
MRDLARNRARDLWGSTVVRKALAAASGLALLVWVVLHMAGNLTLYAGPAAADGYAAALRRAPALLWTARAGLLAAAAVHVAAVTSLARAGRAARPRRLERRGQRGLAALAAGSMRAGGVLLLAFVGYHLAHMTFGVAHPAFRAGHVYANVTAGLRAPTVAAAYVAGAALLGLHVFHGLWAAARSFGARPAAAAERRRPLAAAVAAALAVGFASIPVAVLAGWLR